MPCLSYPPWLDSNYICRGVQDIKHSLCTFLQPPVI
jgi:hypothetical protein